MSYLAIAKRVLREIEERKVGEISARNSPQRVSARVRGQDGIRPVYDPEVCWHCHGELRCSCALCGACGESKTWIEGQCVCCKGTGYLSWETVQ